MYNQTIHSTTQFTPFELLYGPYLKPAVHTTKADKKMFEIFNQRHAEEMLPL